MTKFYLYGYFFNKYALIKAKYDLNFKNDYYKSLYDKNHIINTNSLKELVEICSKNKIRLLVTNIPDLRILENYPYNFATEYIKKTMKNLNTEFLDFYSLIKDKPPESLWVTKEDPHANSKTNYLFASAIYNKLDKLNWLK